MKITNRMTAIALCASSVINISLDIQSAPSFPGLYAQHGNKIVPALLTARAALHTVPYLKRAWQVRKGTLPEVETKAVEEHTDIAIERAIGRPVGNFQLQLNTIENTLGNTLYWGSHVLHGLASVTLCGPGKTLWNIASIPFVCLDDPSFWMKIFYKLSARGIKHWRRDTTTVNALYCMIPFAGSAMMHAKYGSYFKRHKAFYDQHCDPLPILHRPNVLLRYELLNELMSGEATKIKSSRTRSAQNMVNERQQAVAQQVQHAQEIQADQPGLEAEAQANLTNARTNVANAQTNLKKEERSDQLSPHVQAFINMLWACGEAGYAWMQLRN